MSETIIAQGALLSEEELMQATRTVKEDTAHPVEVDEVDVLFAPQRVWEINGETIEVKEFTFGQLPKAIKLLKTVGHLFAIHSQQGTISSPEAIMQIVSEGGDDVIELLAFNVGKKREWFDTVPADTGIELLLHFLIINISFFTNRVLPAIPTMASALSTRGA